MKRNAWMGAAALLVCVTVGCPSIGLAVEPATKEEMGAIKDRMAQRLEDIETLKQEGKLGETWEGYLETVKGQTLPKEMQKVVEAENTDRAVVYATIADKLGVSTTRVARRRAKQLFEQAEKGEWLKHEKEGWVQK